MAASINSRFKYQTEIQAMCYTFGDVRNTHPSTSELIEDIVKQRIVSLTVDATQVTQRRGSRFMNIDDVMFTLRHDETTISRIIDFLSWKEVRRNLKQASNNTADDTEVVADEEEGKLKLPKRKRVKLSFDFVQSLTEGLVKEEDLEEDEESSAMHYQETLLRLREADETTRQMTKEEYMEYAECRQASFTFKKGKRFREWLNLGVHTDVKPNDEILDILGYVAWELVERLTRTSILVKSEWELFQPDQQKKTRFTDRDKMNKGLFVIPNDKTPILPEHVREAFRRMQCRDNTMELFEGVKEDKTTLIESTK